jgi:hypothetical protein
MPHIALVWAIKHNLISPSLSPPDSAGLRYQKYPIIARSSTEYKHSKNIPQNHHSVQIRINVSFQILFLFKPQGLKKMLGVTEWSLGLS